jgi:hypothetical protein
MGHTGPGLNIGRLGLSREHYSRERERGLDPALVCQLHCERPHIMPSSAPMCKSSSGGRLHNAASRPTNRRRATTRPARTWTHRQKSWSGGSWGALQGHPTQCSCCGPTSALMWMASFKAADRRSFNLRCKSLSGIRERDRFLGAVVRTVGLQRSSLIPSSADVLRLPYDADPTRPGSSGGLS